MPLLSLIDHLRRTSRCWVALALVLSGAFLLPQVGAAGAATPAVSSAAPTAVNAPPPGPDDQLTRKPLSPECSPQVFTCDDVTTDPCIRLQNCPPPPPPPCEQDDECPTPPCRESLRRPCPPPPCEDGGVRCPIPPCEEYPEYPEYPDCPPPTECEEGDPECPEPPPVTRPDPTDRPVPARPNFTG